METLQYIDQQSVLDSIYNGIIIIDTHGKITYFNKTAERIFNMLAGDALTRYILDVLPNTAGKLLESLQTRKSFQGEKLKGQTVTLIANINPIIFKEEILGVVSVFQDISEIETISRELDFFKNMKNWLDTVVDSSYDGLWICDREGKVIRINKASERINNVKAEQVQGRSMKDLVKEGYFDKSVTSEVLKRKTSVTMVQKLRSGKRILVTGNPIFDEKGQISFVLTNDRDISELDHLRDQLKETQALAKEYLLKVSELEMSGIHLSNIIFRSREFEKVIGMALKVAKFDSTVLISGESGVGKGMLARLIHKLSDRNEGPFMRIDCAGIPDPLIESELFGYERGAFTGAKPEGKPGLLELANGGTLFLDEIGELPIGSQTKLLRFMEDHEIIRVGGTESRQINVRVIAATNKNIEELVSLKLLREDLYYRLNVVPIFIPPLRERRDDILPLIYHYLDKFNKTYQKKKILSQETLDVFCKYHFPGNTRELANLVERLIVSIEENRIETNDLPKSLIELSSKITLSAHCLEDLPLKEAVKELEKNIIEKAIKKHGSRREAARVLKIDRATISRKLRKKISSKNGVILHK